MCECVCECLKTGHGSAPVSGILNRRERERERGREREGYYSGVLQSDGLREEKEGEGGKSVNQRLTRLTFFFFLSSSCVCFAGERES